MIHDRLGTALLLAFAAASPLSAQRYVKEAGSEHFLFLKNDGSGLGLRRACGARRPVPNDGILDHNGTG